MKRSIVAALAIAVAATLAAVRLRWPSHEDTRAAERGSDAAHVDPPTSSALSERTPAVAEPMALAEPTPTAAATTRDTVRIRTVDMQGAVVRNAELFETTDSGSQRVGSSGPSGEVELSFERRAWTALVGRHAAFGPARISWHDQAPPTVELRLAEVSAISGRVVFADGQGAPDGLRVIAIPTRLNMAALGCTGDELVANPEFASTLTEPDGRFRIAGLAAGEIHALHCGGRGFLAHGQPPYARAGDEKVLITVARGYGVVFEFVDVSGAGACVPEVYGAQGSFNMTIADASAELVLNLPPSARMALGALSDFVESPLRRLILLSSPLDLAELGPIKIDCALPGYAPIEQECFAVPIESNLAVWTQPLVRSARDFGDIQVDLEPAAESLRDSLGRVGPVATFELVAAGQLSFVRVLRPDARGQLTLDCVPMGPHEVMFVSQPETDGSRIPLGEVLIGRQAAVMELPMNRLGALTVGARLEDGREYVGELRVALGGLPGGKTSAVNTPLHGGETTFRHSPYHFALLPAGAYRVWVTAPGVGSSPADVVVEPRSAARVELTIRL